MRGHRWLPGRRALRWTATGLVLAVVLPLVAAVVFLRGLYSGGVAADAHTRGRDAIWLGHGWVDGRNDDTDLALLASRLRESGIRDVYVHAGPLDGDGGLPEGRHPRARWLLDGLAERLPEVRVQAWIGQMVADGPDPELLWMGDPAVRGRVVDAADALLDLGFGGFHLNVETVRSGDPHLLALLDALGPAVRGRDAVLSASAQQIDPLPNLHRVGQALFDRPKWWSQAYFGQVAERVDQIAVMSYDAGMPTESLYGGFVAQQTELALQVTPEDTDLLMGLPFYHDSDLPHRSETVPAAVRGVRLGLSRGDSARERFGVALYVDYGATTQDWRHYRQDWVAPAGD